jgi:hypothetical protein
VAQSVRAGGLQYRPAIAVDDNGCKRRGIIFEAGVTVAVAGMGVVRTGMIMPSRVGNIAGDRKGRNDRGARQQAVTKPGTGFEFHQYHW